MKLMARRSLLNPAFKRFQYLPHLPGSGRAADARPAPRWDWLESGNVTIKAAQLQNLSEAESLRPKVILE